MEEETEVRHGSICVGLSVYYQGSLLEIWVPLQVWELLTVAITTSGLSTKYSLRKEIGRTECAKALRPGSRKSIF